MVAYFYIDSFAPDFYETLGMIGKKIFGERDSGRKYANMI